MMWTIYLWGTIPAALVCALLVAIDLGRESAKGSKFDPTILVAAFFLVALVGFAWPLVIAALPFVGVAGLSAKAYRRGVAKLETQRDCLVNKALEWEQLAAAPGTAPATVAYAQGEIASLRARAEAIKIPPVKKKN